MRCRSVVEALFFFMQRLYKASAASHSVLAEFFGVAAAILGVVVSETTPDSTLTHSQHRAASSNLQKALNTSENQSTFAWMSQTPNSLRDKTCHS